MQLQQGYIVTLLGNSFQKETLFLETKPTPEEVEKMLKDTSSVRAFVTQGEIYTVDKGSVL